MKTLENVVKANQWEASAVECRAKVWTCKTKQSTYHTNKHDKQGRERVSCGIECRRWYVCKLMYFLVFFQLFQYFLTLFLSLFFLSLARRFFCRHFKHLQLRRWDKNCHCKWNENGKKAAISIPQKSQSYSSSISIVGYIFLFGGTFWRTRTSLCAEHSYFGYKRNTHTQIHLYI